MTPAIVIADYGVGNLRSVARAVESCGAKAVLATDPATVDSAERLILPGVGAFGSCVAALRSHNLTDAVVRVVGSGRPVLGICVGMQMLLDASEEFGRHEGLGIVPGIVSAIPDTGIDNKPHKIPHIGWSALKPGPAGWGGTIFEGIPPDPSCYFVHSFAAEPQQPEHVLATFSYNGRKICAAVRKGNVYGVQFHPEKSGTTGLKILFNFLALAPIDSVAAE